MDEAAIAKATRLRHQEWPMGLKAELLTNLFRGSPGSKSNARKKETEIMTATALTEKIKLVESDSQNLSLLSIFS